MPPSPQDATVGAVKQDDVNLVDPSMLQDESTPANNNAILSSTDTTPPTTSGEQQEPLKSSWFQKLVAFYVEYDFLILVVLVIVLARAYPPLGAIYVAPQITATWIAVLFIFVLAGLGLKTQEFTKAFQRIHFNAFVQIFNFFVVSAIVYGFSRLMITVQALSTPLADGMVICSALPLTINMVLVLTKSGGGDEAAAIFNAAFGNLVGVFLSPVLILGYLGVTADVDLLDVFTKLALRVVVPIAVGQVLQKTSKTVVDFVKKYKQHFKQAQQYALVFIVYTVFCKTFQDDTSTTTTIGSIFLMILFQFIILCAVMILAWVLLRFLFRNEPTLCVMGLFGCTHKTVAMGVPLINAIYESNPNVGLYTLPLLIWHPMQLVLGTLLVPRLNKFVLAEKERLGIKDDDDDDDDDDDQQEISTDTPVDGYTPADEEQPSTAPPNEEVEESPDNKQ